MTNRLSQGEVIVGGLEVETEAQARSLVVETQATVNDLQVNNSITGVDSVQFDVLASAPSAIGTLRWNDTDGTLDLGLKGNNVTLNIGEQEFLRVKHADNSGLERGKVVYFVGSDGNNKTVRYASASVEGSSVNVLGMMAETVTGGNSGWCCTTGFLKDINTNHLTEGTVAWLSASAGAVSSTKPTPPDHGVQIGYVIRKNQNNGVLFIAVQNGYELDELHNVLISNPQEGQVLKYSASAGGVWRNQNP